jgi:hypothetical protein
MKKRSPAVVFILGFITFGIYPLYWYVDTRAELNKLGAKIPTAWIILIPVVGGLYFLWKYSEGVDQITGGKLSKVMAFLLLWLLGGIGQAITQDYYNKLGNAPVAQMNPGAPTAMPVTSSQPMPFVAATPAPMPEQMPPAASMPATNPMPPTDQPPTIGTPPTGPIVG